MLYSLSVNKLQTEIMAVCLIFFFSFSYFWNTYHAWQILTSVFSLSMIITFVCGIIRKSHVLIIFMLLFSDFWNKNHLISLSVAIIVWLVLKLNNEINQLQPGELVPKQTLIRQSGKRMRQFHKFMMQTPVDKLARQSLIILCSKLC